MTFEEYRDLTEALTNAGNQAWRHKDCPTGAKPITPLMRHIRECGARAAWEWSNGIGIPPINNGEERTFKLDVFKFLAGEGLKIATQEAEEEK